MGDNLNETIITKNLLCKRKIKVNNLREGKSHLSDTIKVYYQYKTFS